MSFFSKQIKVQSSEAKEYQVLAEGVHSGVIVGMVAVEVTDFEDATKVNEKFQLVFQVNGTDIEDNDCIKYIATKAIAASVNEKSNLFKLLASPLKVKTPEELDAKFGGVFSLDKLIGAKFQVVVTHTISKDGKTYENITSLIAAKKSDPEADLTIEVPSFITKKAFDSLFLDGIKISEAKAATTEPAESAAIASVTMKTTKSVAKVVPVPVEEDETPFEQFKK